MKKTILAVIELVALPFGIFIIFSLLTDGFGAHSIPIILSQSMIPVVTGFGLAIMMNAELMDFSMGARAVFAATIGGVMAQNYGMLGLIAGCFIGSMAAAVAMAVIYRLFHIPAMVISIGVLLIYEVLAAKMAGSSGYVKIPAELYKIGSYPMNIIIVVLAAVLFYILFYKMRIGSHITAVGNDEKMCKNLGINADRVKFIAITLTGIFCFFSAILTICYSGSITASTDMQTMSLVFKPIMCVILARHLRKLLDCMPLLIFIGGICITMIFNGFIAMGFGDALQDIILGLFLIVVLGSSAASSELKKMKMKRNAKKGITA